MEEYRIDEIENLLEDTSLDDFANKLDYVSINRSTIRVAVDNSLVSFKSLTIFKTKIRLDRFLGRKERISEKYECFQKLISCFERTKTQPDS